MSNYFITVSNGIFTPDHYKRIGSAIWLFEWYLDKVTIITKEGEGLVLGGQPVKYEMYHKATGVSEKTYRRDMDRLKKEGYIKTLRTPYGVVVKVQKCKKIFSKRDSDVSKMTDHSPTVPDRDRSDMTDLQNKGEKREIGQKRPDRTVKNDRSNKIIQLDNTNNTNTGEKSPGPKKEKKKKEVDPKKEDFKALIKFWHDHVPMTRGIEKPEYSKQDYGGLKALIARTPLKREDTEKIMLFFLADRRYKRLGPSLATFCSKGIQTSLINDFKNDQHFFKNLYDYADRYMQQYQPPTAEQHNEFKGRIIQLGELLTKGFLDKIKTGR